MPVILETISWILRKVNVGVDRLIVGYGVRFVYSDSNNLKFCLLSITFLKRIKENGFQLNFSVF